MKIRGKKTSSSSSSADLHSSSLSVAPAFSLFLPAKNPQISFQSSSTLPLSMKDPEPPKSTGESSEAPPPPPCATSVAAAVEKGGTLDAVGPPEGGERSIDGLYEAAAGPSPERATAGSEPLSEAAAASPPPTASGQQANDGGEEKDGMAEKKKDGEDEGSVAKEMKDGMAEEKRDEVDEGNVAKESEDGMAEEKKDGVDEDSVAKEKKDGMDEGTVVKEKTLANKDGVGAAVVLKKKGMRTSCYHGVTRHKWTKKYEAHLYDRTTVNIESRKRKGKQVYLGGYDAEEKAARAYDLGALKYWGVNAGTKLNFPISDYEKELMEMENMNRDEWVASLRRRSSGFSRGVSVYRGVARRKDGKWQARVGTSVSRTKDIYLGAFNTEEEAAIAYDIAVVELRGRTAITNFDISNYLDDDLRQ